MPSRRRAVIWLALWLATRALTVCQAAFSTIPHRGFEDVANYEIWAHILSAHGEFPGGPGWQYPPGAALMMLVPRAIPASYGVAFIGLMLVLDFIGLLLLARLAVRTGRDTGVWVWLFGMPLLGTFALLRFDLVPTVIAIGALVVIHRRPGWFGALVGLGAAIKVWPALLLFGEWDRRRLLRAVLVAAAVGAFILVVSVIAFGGATGFLTNGGGRGLQEEAVATAPWQLTKIVSGDGYPRAVSFGAWEIASPTADSVAAALRVLTLLALAAAAFWWWSRARLIRSGRQDLADPTVSRDFIFTVVLMIVVTSPVLSPQYMVWLLGLAAVVLSSATQVRRPAWILLGAAVLTTATTGSPELTLLRNLALLVAVVDSSVSMARLLLPAVHSPPPQPSFSSAP